MANGIQVAETDLPGTATQDKTFTSEALSPKDRIEDDGSVTTDGSGKATAVVTHGLPYPPVCLFFFRPGNTNAGSMVAPSWVSRMKSTDWGFMDNFTFTAYTNALTINIRIQGKPNTLYQWHYFIFVEPAAI